MTPQRLTNSQRSARPARQPQIADNKTALRRAQAADKEQVLRRAQAALSAPALASPAEVLALQAVGGNRAVRRVLASGGPVRRDAAGASAGGSLAGGPLHSQSEAMLRQSRGGGQRLDPQRSTSAGFARAMIRPAPTTRLT